MSRSGYSLDLDEDELELYRNQVDQEICSKRGQALLREALAALDAMPVKALISDLLIDGDHVCLLGAVGVKQGRGADLEKLDPEDHRRLARMFNCAECLIQEIEHINDDAGRHKETPEDRFQRVRQWLVDNIVTGGAS